MSEQEMEDRIIELQKAVSILLELYTKECKSHNETQMYVIKLQKRIIGLADD